MAMGFSGHGADGFIKGRGEGQFGGDPLDQGRIRLDPRQAMKARHEMVRGIVQKPGTPVHIDSAVTGQQGSVGHGDHSQSKRRGDSL